MKTRRVMMGLTKQTGLSLVEIMVALTLSLLLIAGVGQIYLGSKQTYSLQEAQSRLQETARFALEVLTHDIRLAGYIGCARILATNPAVIANAPLVAPIGTAPVIAAPIVTGGNDNTGSFTDPNPALSSSLANNVVSGTDALTVQFGESCGGATTSAMNGIDPTGLITVGNTCGIINAGDPLVIANCQSVDIFRAIDASQNTTASLSRTYPIGSEILLFRSYTYYIRQNPASQPALYRFDNNSAPGGNNPSELVEGVEDMQILYGVDTDNDRASNQYVTADIVTAGNNWNNVVGVRISLLLRTLDDNLVAAPQTYTYNGATAIAPDRRLRQVFTTTIGLRNQLP